MPRGVEKAPNLMGFHPTSGVMEDVMVALSDTFPVCFAARGYVWIEHNGMRYRLSIDREPG